MADPQNISDLVCAVFRSWKKAEINFLVLRNYEFLPEFTSHDIDVLLDPRQLRLAEIELVAAARTAEFHLHNRAEFGPLSLFFYHPSTSRQIQFDLFGALRWRGLTLLPTERALAQKTVRGDFAIPHSAHEAVLNLITRLLYRSYVKESYRPKIQWGFQNEPDEALALLMTIFGTSLGKSLFENAIQGNWKSIEARAGELRRALILRELTRHPFRSLRSFASDIFRLARRFVHPPGPTVALLGPDGCGKSSISAKVIEGLSQSFPPDKGFQVHWKPIVFFPKRRRNRPPATNPHAQPPRNKLVSAIFLAYHWLEFFLGYWLQIRPVRFKNGLVMIDRFYYDFLIDPKRYRLKVPNAVVRTGEFFLPRLDRVFLLDAPTDVLQKRKQEVPIEETERQRRAFLDLIKRLPNAEIIDAARPMEDVTADIVRSVLETCRERAHRRNSHRYE